MHPTIPVNKYTPSGGPKFISLPDPRTTGILSDEIHQADAYIHAWCAETGHQRAANLFFNPPADSGIMPAFAVVQADGLDSFFGNLPKYALDGANYGCSGVRFVNSIMLPATDGFHNPVNGQVAAPVQTSGTNVSDSYPVSWNVEGSVYRWRLDCFQRSMNKGQY